MNGVVLTPNPSPLLTTEFIDHFVKYGVNEYGMEIEPADVTNARAAVASSTPFPRAHPGAHHWDIEANGVVVGDISVAKIEGDWELTMIVFDPHSGNGHGRAALQTFLGWNQYRPIFGTVRVRNRNQGSIVTWLQGAGFVITSGVVGQSNVRLRA